MLIFTPSIFSGNTVYQFTIVTLPPDTTYSFVLQADLTDPNNALYPFISGTAPTGITDVVRTDKRYLTTFVDNHFYFYDEDVPAWTDHGLINITTMPI